MALYGPAWQSSVNEQVPPKMLPAAITLNSISFNIARSFGPAIGGVIVAAAGSVAAFVVNALSYLRCMAVLYLLAPQAGAVAAAAGAAQPRDHFRRAVHRAFAADAHGDAALHDDRRARRLGLRADAAAGAATCSAATHRPTA